MGAVVVGASVHVHISRERHAVTLAGRDQDGRRFTVTMHRRGALALWASLGAVASTEEDASETEFALPRATLTTGEPRT